MLEQVNCELCLEEEEEDGSCLSRPTSYVQAMCSVSYLYRSTECMPGPGLTGPRREGRGRGVVLSSRHVGPQGGCVGVGCLVSDTPGAPHGVACSWTAAMQGMHPIGADHRGARE